jgi:hypothetical protein
MAEGRGAALVVDGRLDEQLVDRAFEVAGDRPRRERIRSALEAVIETAEVSPEEARDALWALRHDSATLERLERCLGGDPERTTFAVGAAIQIIHDELASPAPDLREREAELLRWLENDW